jgi:hypothetical protein
MFLLEYAITMKVTSIDVERLRSTILCGRSFCFLIY